MRFALLLASMACAPIPGSYAKIAGKAGFAGPRQITIVGANPNLLDQLEAKLEGRGFRVSRDVPDVLTSLKSRYVLRIEGACWQRVVDVGDMKAEVYDVDTNERLFVARLINNDWCPQVFLDDVVAAIDRTWPG